MKKSRYKDIWYINCNKKIYGILKYIDYRIKIFKIIKDIQCKNYNMKIYNT